jgi:hypothetical protein
MAHWSTIQEYGDMPNRPRVCLKPSTEFYATYVPTGQFDVDIMEKMGWAFQEVQFREYPKFLELAFKNGYSVEVVFFKLPEPEVRWGYANNGTKLFSI